MLPSMKNIAFVCTLVLCTNALSVVSPEPFDSPDTFSRDIARWSQTFGEMLQLVHKKYYLAIDPQEAMIRAMNAFLSFDPHSRVLDPTTYQGLLADVSGEFSGVGVVIAPKKTTDDMLLVIDVVDDGPADRAGIQPQDKILAVDTVSVLDLTTDEVVAKLKGKKGSSVTLTLISGHRGPFNLTITRNIVKDDVATCIVFKDFNILYLSLKTFLAHNIVELTKRALAHAERIKAHGFILDLRDNGGGALHTALETTELFVPEKSLLLTLKDRHVHILETHISKQKPPWKGQFPLIILVNQFTASAAEIMAGILRCTAEKMTDRRSQIFIMGTQTSGKASVQDIIPLSNNCALKITSGLYYLPDESIIQGIGIEPDIIIEKALPPSEESKILASLYGNEKNLNNALKVAAPQKQSREKGAAQKRRIAALAQDTQIHAAIAAATTLHRSPHETRSAGLKLLKKTFITKEPELEVLVL